MVLNLVEENIKCLMIMKGREKESEEGSLWKKGVNGLRKMDFMKEVLSNFRFINNSFHFLFFIHCILRLI